MKKNSNKSSMNVDSVDCILMDYEKLLRIKLPSLPPRLVQLSGSELFAANGFPSSNVSTRNLASYLDSQQENRGHIYANLIGGIDKQEIQIITNALEVIKNANKKAVVSRGGVSALLHGFFVAREIHGFLHSARTIISNKRNLNIIEIGAGSGWTSYFLRCYGINVSCVEVNANFIATQDFLMNTLSGEKTGKYARIHWWDFYNHKQKQNSPFDCLIMNHMFCEITDWARKYISKWAHQNLNEYGLIFLQSWGDERFCSRYEAIEELNRHHWHLLSIRDPFQHGEIYALTKRQEEHQISRLATIAKRVQFAKLEHLIRSTRSSWKKHEKEGVLSVSDFLSRYGITEEGFHDPTFIFAGIKH